MKPEKPHSRTFEVESLRVVVGCDLEGMAALAAREAAGILREALQRQPEARAIFASAASQARFLDRLVVEPDVDWSRVVCFHMDEYLGIESSHPASFRRFLEERLVRRVRPARFHTLAGEADEPVAECERYARLVTEAAMDLCVLGIGENGHLAFNDPHVARFDDPQIVKIVRLDEACRRQQVGEGAFPALEAVPQFAYTLTVPTLCAAGRMVCVVPEGRKAGAVQRALEGELTPACPASVLRRQAHAALYLDPDSAGLLSGTRHG